MTRYVQHKELQGKARDLKKLIASNQHEAELKQQQTAAKVSY